MKNLRLRFSIGAVWCSFSNRSSCSYEAPSLGRTSRPLPLLLLAITLGTAILHELHLCHLHCFSKRALLSWITCRMLDARLSWNTGKEEIFWLQPKVFGSQNLLFPSIIDKRKIYCPREIPLLHTGCVIAWYNYILHYLLINNTISRAGTAMCIMLSKLTKRKEHPKYPFSTSPHYQKRRNSFILFYFF